MLPSEAQDASSALTLADARMYGNKATAGRQARGRDDSRAHRRARRARPGPRGARQGRMRARHRGRGRPRAQR